MERRLNQIDVDIFLDSSQIEHHIQDDIYDDLPTDRSANGQTGQLQAWQRTCGHMMTTVLMR